MKTGDKVKLKSNDYNCLQQGVVYEVKLHSDGHLYIECDRGNHYIDSTDNCDFEVINVHPSS